MQSWSTHAMIFAKSYIVKIDAWRSDFYEEVEYVVDVYVLFTQDFIL